MFRHVYCVSKIDFFRVSLAQTTTNHHLAPIPSRRLISKWPNKYKVSIVFKGVLTHFVCTFLVYSAPYMPTHPDTVTPGRQLHTKMLLSVRTPHLPQSMFLIHTDTNILRRYFPCLLRTFPVYTPQTHACQHTKMLLSVRTPHHPQSIFFIHTDTNILRHYFPRLLRTFRSVCAPHVWIPT